MRRAGFISTLLLISLALGNLRVRASAPDDRALDDLRKRGEFAQAEKYCADRLADPQLPEARRVDLTVELSRNLADQALRAPPTARQPLWDRARRAVDEFAARNPRHPKLALVRAQGALAMLAEGEVAREDAEGNAAEAARYRARRLLRGAINELRRLDEAVAADLQRSTRAARDDNATGLSVAELMSLDAHLRYQLARGLRNQALCYPAKSADRINSLSQSLDLLRTLAQQKLSERLTWNVWLDEIACRRLLEEFGTAEQKLALLESKAPPADVAPRLTAERIRLAMARGRIDEALSEAGSAAARQQANSPEADQARLEAYLAGWQRASHRHQADDAQEWEKTALDQLRTIEQAHGQPWLRQAEALLARSMAGRAGPSSVEALVLAGDGHYRNGQLDEALSAYDQAARQSREGRKNEQALEIAFTAATIEKGREHHREAIDRYRKLAMFLPSDPRAPEAHLLAIYSAGQLAEQQKPPRLDEYERLLREHLSKWPRSPTAAQAWWWLGRLEEHEHVYQEAVRALRNVPPDHPQYVPALEATGRCYLALFDQLRHDGKPTAQPAAEAIRYFEQALAGGTARQTPPKPVARAAALAAARIYLQEMPQGATQAESLLSRALRDAVDAPRDWQIAARSLLVAALAAQDRIPQAETALGQLTIGSPAEGLSLVTTLGDLAQRATGRHARDIAALELTVIDDLLAQRDELEAPLADLARRHATALSGAGRRGEAIAAWQALAEANPRDGAAQEELALLLMAGEDAEQLQAAADKWRQISGKSRLGSPRWYRAHLNLAQTQLTLGDAAQARATIQRVAADHPDFGGAELQARFRELLAACDQSTGAKK
jgi:TolA-binding protein